MHPHRIDVARARRAAKALLAAARRGDGAALAELRSDRSPLLADAQRAVARRHGFRSWPDLLAATRDLGWELRAAARLGDDDVLYGLLDDGVDANAADPTSGRTALHEAAAADQLATVSALVGWIPADQHRVDRSGRTPFQLAPPGSPVATVLARFESSAAEAVLTSAHAGLAADVELLFVEHLSRAPDVERWPVGDGFAFRSGLEDNSRNGVVAGHATVDEVAATLTRLADVPATWFAGADGFSPELAVALERAGAHPERTAVHMHADLSSIDARRDRRAVETTDPETLAGIDPTEAKLLLAAGAPVRAFVLDGVAAAVTFTVGSTVLGVHLDVARTHRRRGLARTLVRHVAAVNREAGCDDAIVSPTVATIPFYERLGFTLERSEPDHSYYL